MAKELTKDKIKNWFGWIEACQKYQEKFGRRDQWSKWVKGYAGDFNSKNELGDDAVEVNMIFPTAKTILPPLYVNEPYIIANPKNDESVHRAKLNEQVANYWRSELKIRTKVVKPCILDAYNVWAGFAKVGYVTDTAMVETKKGFNIAYSEYIKNNQPYCVRVSPQRILVPPLAVELDEMPFVIHHVTKLLDDVKESEYYKNTKNLKASRVVSEKSKDKWTKLGSEFLNSGTAEMIDLYEIWDIREGKIIVLAEGNHDAELRNDDWESDFEGYPFVELCFNKLPDEYYGISDVSTYYEDNKNLNYAATIINRRMRRYKGMLAVPKTLEEEIRKQVGDADDGAILGIDEAEKSVKEIRAMQLEASLLNYFNHLINVLFLKTGVPQERRGAHEPGVETATQSANIEKWASVRDADRGDCVSEFYKEIFRRIMAGEQQYAVKERLIKITGGSTEAYEFQKYNRKSIQGEFDYDIHVSYEIQESKPIRIDRALKLYNLMAADPGIDRSKLQYDIFEAFDKKNIEQYMKTLRTPEEEHEMIFNGLPVEAKEEDNHQEHDKKHTAFLSEIEDQISKAERGTEEYGKLTSILAITMAHLNNHAQIVMMIREQMVGSKRKVPGQPLAENLFREKEFAGTETAAEEGGQPL